MQFQRKRNKKKQRIIFISVLTVLIAALTVSAVFLTRALTNEEETEEGTKTLLPILPEEGRYNSYPTAFPPIDVDDITIISIENEKGSYFMAVPTDGSSDSFEFYYDADEEGNYTYYSPDILLKEDGMEYEELYAKVTGDGYDRIRMLDYLIAAIRAPYFDYRIYLSDDLQKRNEELAIYGLAPDKSDSEDETAPDGEEAESSETDTPVRKIVHLYYLKSDGSLGEYVIEIGKNTVTGSGYYYRIGDKADSNDDGVLEIVYRDYIYVTGEQNYFKYALVGIEAYINPVLVSGALDSDQHSMYAPYLTPDYRQWQTEIHKLGSLPSDLDEMKNVTDVFATVDAYMPVYVYDSSDGIITNTVEKTPLGSYIFNLTELEDNKLYPYLINALRGKEIGKGSSLMQSVIYDKNVAEGTKYRYKITDVESVITMAGEINTSGTPVGENRYIRVTYLLMEYNEKTGEYELADNITKLVTDENGETTFEYASAPTQGIIDLEYLRKAGVPEEKINSLMTVGEVYFDGSLYVEIDVTYTKKNDAGESSGLSYKNMAYTIDEVLEIYEPEYDEDGKLVSYKRTTKLTDTSLVAYRYYYVYENTEGEKAQSASIGYINMASDDDEANHEKLDKIRAAIKKWDNLTTKSSVEALKENIYTDIASDFIFYVIKDISGYITGKLVSAFRFVNVSERDPFFGESFYERTDDYMLYAMNQDACDKVVKQLGGLTESSATGLSGMETVKVGITPETLYEYGCYEYIVRYSLPREIYISLETEQDEYDDYGWMRTLDFVLYVSKTVWDPDTETWVKYVASEMYNIIVKIEAEKLGFIDLDTVDFWARRNLILIDSKVLGEMNVEFKMDDIQGKYRFKLNHYPTDIGSATEYDWIDVEVYNQSQGNGFGTRFDEYVAYNAALPNGHKDKELYPTLGGFYDYLAGEPVSADSDSRGTGMFKELLLMMYLTTYMGTLTEEEQATALENGPLLKINVKLDGTYDANADTEKIYYYDFYRCDDSRVMVRIYERKNDAVVGGKYASDFYITSLAFEKIVSNFIGVLNGEIIDVNNPYPDFKPIT